MEKQIQRCAQIVSNKLKGYGPLANEGSQYSYAETKIIRFYFVEDIVLILIARYFYSAKTLEIVQVKMEGLSIMGFPAKLLTNYTIFFNQRARQIQWKQSF